MTATTTFNRAFTVDTSTLTRAEAIGQHEDNITAIRRRIQRVGQGPDDEHTRRALRLLRRDLADEEELIELARCEQYPFPLKDDEE